MKEVKKLETVPEGGCGSMQMRFEKPTRGMAERHSMEIPKNRDRSSSALTAETYNQSKERESDYN